MTAVRLRTVVLGAHLAELRAAGDEECEAVRLVGGAIVGDDHERMQLAGAGIETLLLQGAREQALGLGDGGLDREE
jgi:hypothetical protein